jgi:predicted nuclease of predicted toxin-antitoxin system
VPDRPLAFKVDENLPEDVAAASRDAGYEASTATSQGLAGIEDARLTELVRQEGRVPVTLDVDFGDIRAYPPDEYPGIIVIRMARKDKPRILAAIRRLLPLLATKAVTRRL